MNSHHLVERAQSPLAESSTIVVAGLRNAGKSTLINSLFGREVSIASPVPGTTTDPVSRKMELPSWGPVAIVDTPGLDDVGELGEKRVQKARARLASASAILFASPGHLPLGDVERGAFEELRRGGRPVLVVLTHADQGLHPDKSAWPEGCARFHLDARSGSKTKELVLAIAALAPAAEFEASPLEGLVSEGDHLLLVAPIDLAAPKGRLIQPQTETIRDALDRDCVVTVVKERELYDAYRSFTKRPKLVVTDSQAFSKAAADLDEDQSLTSFSILFARKKGELAPLLRGLSVLPRFSPSGRVFVFEACSHHRGADDIGSVKIPRLFGRLVNPKVPCSSVRSIPPDLGPEDLVILCGSCMATRAATLERMRIIESRGAALCNYGVFLAWANGLIPRALEPLPEYASLYAPLCLG